MNAASPTVREVVARLTRDGNQRRLDDRVDTLWAALTGLVMLTMFGRIAGGAKRARTLIPKLVDDLVRAWTRP